jgi:uncharacterized HAD superfamily protein
LLILEKKVTIPTFVFASDADDVHFDTNTGLASFHNAMYGTSYTREDMRHYDLSLMWNCSMDELRERMDQFHLSLYHHEMTATPGAREATEILLEHCEMPIITARHPEVGSLTRALFNKHSSLIKEIHFLGSSRDYSLRESKASMCGRRRVNLYIEDALHHAVPVGLAGVPVLLLDSPWNQTDDLPQNVTRVRGWAHATELALKRIEQFKNRA